jgi:hypothetical protein
MLARLLLVAVASWAPAIRADTPGPTPRAGRAYATTVAGTPVAIDAFDRGHLTSWDVGVASSTLPAGIDALPFYSLYLFRRTDERQLLRAVVAGFFNEVLFARRVDADRGFEWLLSASSFSPPVAEVPRVDGIERPAEEMVRGEFRAGLGLGVRGRAGVAPGETPDVDNMWEANLVLEPTFRWFLPGERTVRSFVLPASHQALQLHGVVRTDGLTRNLLGGNHAGVAAGGRVLVGARSGFLPWSRDRTPSATWSRAHGWIVGAAPVAALPEQHRLLYTLHGGIGGGLDLTTAFRVGGGPPREEYFANESPVLPGASIEEYPVYRYAIASLEYRHEPIFFFYWGPSVTLAVIDREHLRAGHIVRTDDVLGAAGIRVTTGFLFSTRIQIQYGVNADLLRATAAPRQELTAHVSGRL